MKNIKLSVLLMLGLQSMVMQAAVESKDDYEDQRQAIIDEAMQPENYINLKSGFALLQSQGLNVPSFHDLLEQNVFQSDDEELDLDAITAQAEDIFTSNMKKPFLTKLEIAIEERKTLNQINDPIFKYVMRYKDDEMRDIVNSWLYKWSKTKYNNDNTPLHNAAEKNNAEIVSMLLAADADVNIQDFIGDTPLHRAARNNSVKVVDILLNAGADVNIQRKNGETPLHEAAEKNNTEIVSMLLAAGANVNSKSRINYTPLYGAAQYNNVDIVRILIDASADVNSKTTYGWTPLHMAIINKDTEVARMLINAGADANIEDNAGNTPLYYAVDKDNAEIVRILINAGADVNSKTNDGSTLLHNAVDKNNAEIVRMLINARADVNIQNKYGKAPLYKAVLYNNAEVIQMLINAGADANIQNKNGETAEQIVDTHEIRDLFEQDRRKVQNTEAAGNPINLSANLNHETTKAIFTSNMKKSFLTKLEIAMEERKTLNQINDRIFKYVMKHKDDDMYYMVNSWLYEWSKTKDYFGWTPLHNAAEKNNAEIVSMLLAADADVNIQDFIGDTPLHRAARNNSVKVVDILLNAGANVNSKANNGWTPLHVTAEKNNGEVARMLIDAGADLNIQNISGKTAEQLARTPEMRDLFAQARRKVQNTEAAGNPINLGANLNHETTKDKFAKIFRENRNNNVNLTPLLHKAVRSEVPININNNDYRDNTLLYNYIEICFENHAKSLIAEGVDVNIHNNKGNTPLHRAVLSDCEGIVQPLVNAGANVNSQNEAGNTPLHYAALLKRDNIALQLINAGADVNIQDKLGNTPLHNTTLFESNNIAQQLIDAGANVNIKNNRGETAEQLHPTPEIRNLLQQARRDRQKKVAQKMSEMPSLQNIIASNNLVDLKNDGVAPLFWAVRNNNEEIIPMLINAGVDLNSQDFDRYTPLHYAVYANNKEIVQLLVDAGANLNIQDADGETPEQVAYTPEMRAIFAQARKK